MCCRPRRSTTLVHLTVGQDERDHEEGRFFLCLNAEFFEVFISSELVRKLRDYGVECAQAKFVCQQLCLSSNSEKQAGDEDEGEGAC